MDAENTGTPINVSNLPPREPLHPTATMRLPLKGSLGEQQRPPLWQSRGLGGKRVSRHFHKSVKAREEHCCAWDGIANLVCVLHVLGEESATKVGGLSRDLTVEAREEIAVQPHAPRRPGLVFYHS